MPRDSNDAISSSPLVTAELDAHVPFSGCEVSCGASSRAVRSQIRAPSLDRPRARGTCAASASCRAGRAIPRSERPPAPRSAHRDGHPRSPVKRIRAPGFRPSSGRSSSRSTRPAASRWPTRRSRADPPLRPEARRGCVRRLLAADGVRDGSDEGDRCGGGENPGGESEEHTCL